MINIVDFYNNVYKNNVNRMNAIYIIDALKNKEKNVPIIYIKKNSMLIVKFNILFLKPEFVYDVKLRDIGFSMETMDATFLDEVGYIFEKYFSGGPYNSSILPRKIEFQSTPENKLKFCIEFIDKLYDIKINGH